VVFRDFRHRAAHVDVDNVGTKTFDDLRGGGHLLRIAAEDLNGDRPLLFRVFRVLERPIDAANQPFGRDHLRHDKPATTVALHEAAERRIGHAGHRRDDKRRRQLDGADFHNWTRRRFAVNTRERPRHPPRR
jgi:hypothetical protein